MLIRKEPGIPSSEITPEDLYYSRRAFMRTAAGVVAGAAAAGTVSACGMGEDALAQTGFANLGRSGFSTSEKQNTFEQITTYNNFYEFGTDKSDPARYAGRMKVSPWKVKVDGLVGKPDMHSVRVRRGVDGDRGDAEFFARPLDAKGDLSPVGDQDLVEH